MEKLTADPYEKQAVLDSLAALYPWVRPYYTRPIRDYAFRLFEAPPLRSVPEIRLRAFAKLVDFIEKAARRNGLPADAIARICREFDSRPVMQVGPHLLLLLEPEAFYSHVFSLLGLASHGCSTYVSYAVSTVNLMEKPHGGPGWINVDGTLVNVFGLSRSRMIPSSLLAGPGCYRFELVAANAGAGENVLARLRDLLPNTQFERPAHALKAANLNLWPTLFGDRFAFLQIDDEDIADLVVDHLSDEGSWLRTRLLENSKIAVDILAGLDWLATGPWAGWLTRSTDFFWFYDGGKRLPLRLVAGELIHLSTDRKVARFAVPDIVERLINRSLIPNLLLVFLVLSILPGVRVLGGSHHPIYYPLMRHVVSRALEAAGADADFRLALAADELPSAWGHRVIECNDNPFALLRYDDEGRVDGLIKDLGNIPLAKACGSMHSFVRDPSWLDLQRRLREKTVAPTDAEWILS